MASLLLLPILFLTAEASAVKRVFSPSNAKPVDHGIAEAVDQPLDSTFNSSERHSQRSSEHGPRSHKKATKGYRAITDYMKKKGH
jgi:hypothetical protein